MYTHAEWRRYTPERGREMERKRERERARERERNGERERERERGTCMHSNRLHPPIHAQIYAHKHIQIHTRECV